MSTNHCIPHEYVSFTKIGPYLRLTDRFDDHWKPYYKACQFCDINYNAIVRLENIASEGPIVLKMLAGLLFIEIFATIPVYLKTSNRINAQTESLPCVDLCKKVHWSFWNLSQNF